MSRFADFSIPNGDRDLEEDDELINEGPAEIEESPSVLPPKEDVKNLVIKVIANNQQKGKRVKVDTIPIPRAFHIDYYQSKIDNANFNHDRDAAMKAIAIKRYADIVYEFYRQIMYVFNKKNNIVTMPEYISLCKKIPCDIKHLAEAMVSREQELIKVFNGADNIKQTFEKRKHLTELHHFAAQAWLMYFNLNNLNDFIGYLIYIQNCNNKADKTNTSHIANLYGLHVQTSYYIDANIKNFFSFNNNGLMRRKYPQTCCIYSNLNSIEQFNLLLKEKNAYIYSEHHEEIKKLKTNVPNGTLEKRIVGFYDHYRDMKYVKHKLRQIFKDNMEKEFVDNIFMFDDKFNPQAQYQNRNLFVVGLKYYYACKEMVEQLPIKSKIYKDICDMCVELEEILQDNQDNYLYCKEENKKLEKQFTERHPELAKQFEEKDKDKTISSD